MCGRYTLVTASNLYDRFSAEDLGNNPDMMSDYNVAPGRIMPVVTRNSPNKLVMMKWGLVPFWAKDPKIGYKMINARADSLTTKPSFRNAFKKQRCLVPASGFYEWKESDTKTEKGTKQKIPYYIKIKDQGLFAFAGLYDVWKDAEGKEIQTYTIITTKPNSLVDKIHDRMPVIVAEDNESIWLDGSTDENALKELLQPFSAKKMEAYPVSSDVNNPRNNSENLIKPINPQPLL
jgi:putative SOS response-associated peptidase YedK